MFECFYEAFLSVSDVYLLPPFPKKANCIYAVVKNQFKKKLNPLSLNPTDSLIMNN